MRSTIKIHAIKRGHPTTLHLKFDVPDFHVIPEEPFNGITLPPISIDRQIDEWFTDQDKMPIIHKYDLDCIVDWQIYHRKRREKKMTEGEDFLNFMKSFCEENPELEIPVRSVVSEMGASLFNKGLSSYDKIKIVLDTINCTLLGATAAYMDALRMISGRTRNDDIGQDVFSISLGTTLALGEHDK